VETYCWLALSGQWSGRCPGLCVQAVGGGLGHGWPVALVSDESALEVAWPLDRRLDRRPSAYTTMRYTNRRSLPFNLLTSPNYWMALLCVHMKCCSLFLFSFFIIIWLLNFEWHVDSKLTSTVTPNSTTSEVNWFGFITCSDFIINVIITICITCVRSYCTQAQASGMSACMSDL